MALTRMVLAGFALSVGCAPATVHRPDPSHATPTHVARVESDWIRTAIPAQGVTIAATLWDASLVASALPLSSDATARRAWTQRYLERTAFTVVIELEDRRPVIDLRPFLAPDGWSFGLDLNKGDPADPTDFTAPSDVDLLVVDRFPTESGNFHYRVALAVFFAGTLHEAALLNDTVGLVVKPQIAQPEHGRGMLGGRWAQRGTTLRWRIEASGGPGSGPRDR